MSPRSWPRRAAIVTLVAAASLPLCAFDAPAPTGAAPLRYRDTVFPAVSVSRGITYGEATGADGLPQKLQLDLYQPVGDTSRSRPVMVWVHGGAFRTGNRTSGDVVELATRFARRGYVTASISYRLLGDTPECVQYQLPNVCMKAVLAAASDGQQSVRWLRKYATALRLDPARISMGGSSAGAGVAIVVAASPSAGSPTVPSSTIRTAFSISGASPTNIIFGAGDSPIYFWHGTADTISPIAWARANVGAMQTKGLTAEIHEVAGAGHVPFTQYADDMDTQARNWVYDQMDLARADQRGVPGS